MDEERGPGLWVPIAVVQARGQTLDELAILNAASPAYDRWLADVEGGAGAK